jgi:meiosis induction protein kinase IME2/SME1
MQCGAGARPEWVGKRLVAVKRMKRVWEGGWQQASKLGELVVSSLRDVMALRTDFLYQQSLRELASHPAIIPLYDAFLLPESKELYFVFECMEGNMYQLTKSRKGRALAGGLVASIFHQVVGGLHHIHKSGYFHRDMKPENLLVTTTGLQDYAPVIDPENQVADQAMRLVGLTPPERPAPKVEKDVAVIVKLADFGLARSLESAPPYTEYVSTRWYRAPEVLLRSKTYSAPVDLWAFGTIMAELVNLKALFPGQSEVDQVWRICEVLGDPSADYGVDERGRTFGGGEWVRGNKMAKSVGFAFPKVCRKRYEMLAALTNALLQKTPVHFVSLFPPSTPISLVDCIQDLLRYNPKARLTAEDCLNHPYFHLTQPLLRGVTQLPEIPFAKGQPSLAELGTLLRNIDRQRASGVYAVPSHDDVAARSLPPSHSSSPVHGKSAFGGHDGRTLPPPKISPDIRPFYQTSDRASNYGSQFALQSGAMPSTNNATSASSSQTMLNLPHSRTSRGGASALVDQLRELDLPTDSLSTFGRRPIVSEVASQERPLGDPNSPRVVPPPLQRTAEYANTGVQLDRTLSPYAAPSGSTSSISLGTNASNVSLPAIPVYQRSHLPPHMASPTTLLSGQQPSSPYDNGSHFGSQRSFNSGSGQLAGPGLASLPEDVDMADNSVEPVRHPDQHLLAQSSAALPMSSKKKKWGLSSVFGGSHDKTPSSLPSANIVPLTTNASMSRTQFGAKATDRFQSQVVLPTPQIDISTITDPKKAKKEAERQAKELEKAKREAAERAQKERARAVMQKRTQLEQQRKMAGSKSELEWSHVHGGADKRSEAAHSSKTSHTSGTSVQRQHPESPRPPSLYQNQGAASRSNYSFSAEQSDQQKLSEYNLRQVQQSSMADYYQGEDPYRAKARRLTQKDDHSTSNISVHSGLINASRLTVDSE